MWFQQTTCWNGVRNGRLSVLGAGRAHRIRVQFIVLEVHGTELLAIGQCVDAVVA